VIEVQLLTFMRERNSIEREQKLNIKETTK
jgi:hypothetical protein